MGHDTKPLVRNMVLVIAGGLAIMLFTFAGILNNADLVREDARLGPVIAASKILIPLFTTIGVIYYLAGIKKCKACGKIFFWRNRNKQ